MRSDVAGSLALCEPLERRRLLSAAAATPFVGPLDAPVNLAFAQALTRPKPHGLAAVESDTTALTLTWNVHGADAARIRKFDVTYAPGAYVPGPSGSWQTIKLGKTSRSVRLTGLQPFTLYTIGISAVDVDGHKGVEHLNTWTAEPKTEQRYLYAVDLPKNVQGFTNLKPQIEVFDINNGHKWVKNIPLPSGIYAERGVAASSATGRLYIDFFNTPANTYQTGGLLCLDMNTNKVLWVRHYDKSVVPSPDRFDITPDGKTIYMPVGENGPDNFWEVLDASNGDPLGRINFVTAPHNTIVSVDGSRVFFEGQEKASEPAAFMHKVGVVDTATNTIIQTVGPFNDVVRPFTINGAGTLVYATINNMVGFQIGDVTTGKILYTITPPNYIQPPPKPNTALSHGIAMTPDETKLFVADELKVGFQVWDISNTPAAAPKYLGFIKTRATGKNLAGQTDPAAGNDTVGVPAWIVSSYDGKFMYPESGEIIDTATLKVIGQLRPKTINSAGALIDAPYTHSRFMFEVDFDAGKVVRVTDQVGVGKVR